MSDPTCAACQRPDPTGGVCCHDCAGRARRSLHIVADLTGDARDVAHGQARRGTGRVGGGGGEVRLPLNLAATARLDAAQNELTGWARHVAGERGLPTPAGADPLEVAARWLTGHVEWLRFREEAFEAFEAFGDAERTVTTIADRPPERVIVGACDCGARLYAPRGAAVATCRDCGQRWDVDKSRDILRRHLAKMLATPAEIATMALYLDPDADRRRVRHLITVWATRRRGGVPLITMRGRDAAGAPLYRVGEVLDRLSRPAEEGPVRRAS
ncbi:DUF1922 domain-containing protein [Rhizomonospora bruguierae]|uniref:DUF1922 domain-containing protein n=1 Tax=Rhizomonospora bruguierae TaxID=1581705 RepID=UPI001BCD6532|nr:DUF1922 domain-containing protein [Micromonospora sp. NBRC 107566]